MNIKEEGLLKAQLIAKSLGGELITKEYLSSKTKMLWLCSNKKHGSFFKTLAKVKLNQWCSQCREEGVKVNVNEDFALENFQKEKLEELKTTLFNFKATLLSSQYISQTSSVEIECDICKTINKETPLKILKDGFDCVCCLKTKNNGLNKAHLLAKKMNGVLISTEYSGNKKKLLWKCDNINHPVFEKSFNHVWRGTWCNECRHEKSKIKQKNKIKEKRNIYEEREIIEKKTISLSEKREVRLKELFSILNNKNIKTNTVNYINQYQKIDLICEKCLNNWELTALSVFSPDFNCKKCFPNKYIDRKGNRKNSQQLKREAEILVKNKGGEILKYLPMGRGIFSCLINGHPEWEARVKDIVGNSWCKECANEKYREKNKNKIVDLAKSKNGKCLDPELYSNNKTLLTWKCDNEEHTSWKAHFHSVNTLGSWCPECATNNKSENRTRDILSYLLNCTFPKSYPSWLVNDLTNRQMELDGFNEENKIAFEFQGEQHYKLGIWNTEQTLKEMQYRDELKKKLCKENNITLLIIDESHRAKKWDSLLKEIIKVLNKNNVSFREDVDKEKIKEIFFKY